MLTALTPLLLPLLSAGLKAQDEPAPATAAPRAPGAARDGTIQGSGEEISDAIQRNLARRDPSADGWRSEALHERAKPVLAGLVQALATDVEAQALRAYLMPGFMGTTIRPEVLEDVFSDGVTRVRQPTRGARQSAREIQLFRSFLVSSRALMAPFEREAIHTKSKLFRMELEDGPLFAANALVRIDGPTHEGARMQVNMEWLVHFVEEDEESVRIRMIELLSYEEVETTSELFADLTESAFGHIPRFREEFLIGTGEYHFQLDKLNGNFYTGSMGFAVGDANGDGRDDVYVCQHGGFPNRLLVRLPDGSVEDRSEDSGVDLLDKTQSALFVDLDNDGDQDLVIGSRNAVFIASNDGTGRFNVSRHVLVGGSDEITSLAAADYDQDGDLDLYACVYAKAGPLGTIPVPYHDATNGPPNHLWRNDGELAFSNQTRAVGLDDNNNKYAYAAAWEDFDADGDLDLYVANDFGRNNLYRNDEGHFRDVAVSVGADDMAAGMGVTVADFELDGDMDLYVTNMFSSAGQRIVPQTERFMRGEDVELHQSYMRHARGNSLLLNRGDGTFEDATDASGASVAGWGWGSMTIDLNNDGLPDLYAPNGFITSENSEDL